jgi:hypothetical protein
LLQNKTLIYSLVCGQLQFELAAMIHVEVVMTRIVCMQDELFGFLGSCVKQNVKPKSEIVEEEIAAAILNALMSRR